MYFSPLCWNLSTWSLCWLCASITTTVSSRASALQGLENTATLALPLTLTLPCSFSEQRPLSPEGEVCYGV